MTEGLLVERIVPGASIQDRGRPGYLRFGVTNGGALDQYALAEGQALLGNSHDAAALEMPGYGGRFIAKCTVNIALSGAEMDARLNDTPIGWRRSKTLRQGDVLEIGATREGLIGYLHVEGGFLTPRMLGSRSSHLRAGFGFSPTSGDVLPIGPQSKGHGEVALPRPDYFDLRCLPLLKGPQTAHFTPETLEKFLRDQYSFSPRRDRMGARMTPATGPLDGAADGLTIASDVINHGDIQIGGDGLPVLLMADRGSSGGYPRIGVLARAALDAAAQMPSDEPFSFRLIDRSTAVDLWKKHQALINSLAGSVKPLHRDPRDIADLLAYNLVDGMISAKENP